MFTLYIQSTILGNCFFARFYSTAWWENGSKMIRKKKNSVVLQSFLMIPTPYLLISLQGGLNEWRLPFMGKQGQERPWGSGDVYVRLSIMRFWTLWRWLATYLGGIHEEKASWCWPEHIAWRELAKVLGIQTFPVNISMQQCGLREGALGALAGFKFCLPHTLVSFILEVSEPQFLHMYNGDNDAYH
jgi:hypothetical protein